MVRTVPVLVAAMALMFVAAEAAVVRQSTNGTSAPTNATAPAPASNGTAGSNGTASTNGTSQPATTVAATAGPVAGRGGGAANGSLPSNGTSSGNGSTATNGTTGGNGTAPIPTTGPEATGAPEASLAPSAAPTEVPFPSVEPVNRTNTTDNSSTCFPASATVELASGAIRRMDELAAGDRVKVASGVFSEVFMFTHKLAAGSFEFVKINTASGNTLSLTGGHYIYVNGALSPAETVVVGDELQLGSGDVTTVTEVSCVEGTGLYNPQTLHGDIVVDGVRASTYTTAVEPRLAHAGLSLLRGLYRALGLSVSAFDEGASTLASVLPSGAAAY
jgi:hypothetical protein